MPAVLLEAGSIINRDEELLMSSPERQSADQRRGDRRGRKLLRGATAAQSRSRCRPAGRSRQAGACCRRAAAGDCRDAMSRRSVFRQQRSAGGWRAWAVALPVLALTLGQAAAQGALPRDFVYLRDLDPTIAQDIRYAGSDNFVGRPLPGYGAAECVLRRDVAAVLKQVQADLAGAGLALKVYDCYRPIRATRAMAQWASDGQGGGNKRFFPRLSKTELFARGYIATLSRHSTGTAVDLTMIDASQPQAAELRSGRPLRALHGPGRRARTRQQRRHGHGLRLPRRPEPHREPRHRLRAAAPAQLAGGGHGQTRLSQLSPGMVAFRLCEIGADIAL